MDIREMIRLAKSPPLGGRTVFEGSITPAIPGVEFCKGLVPDGVRESAEKAHTIGVFHKHGINAPEQGLMGDKWCVRLVNARRAVERAIDHAVVEATWKPVEFLYTGYRKIELPPCDWYRGPHSSVQT